MALLESPSVSVTPRGSAPAGGDAECTVVWLQGPHDAATEPFLTAALAGASELDDADVLVDLAAVTFMDASTVGAIVGARKALSLRARSLEIRAPSAAAMRTLELSGLADLVRPTPTAAVHPAGALGTWVEVPSSPATREAVKAPEVQQRKAAALSELDSAGP